MCESAVFLRLSMLYTRTAIVDAALHLPSSRKVQLVVNLSENSEPSVAINVLFVISKLMNNSTELEREQMIVAVSDIKAASKYELVVKIADGILKEEKHK